MKCKKFVLHSSGPNEAADEAAINGFLAGTKVSRLFAPFDGSSSAWLVLIFYDEKPKGAPPADQFDLTSSEEELFNALKAWRNELAKQEALAPYMIAHNLWLKQMVRARATTVNDLLEIKGFGRSRAEKYGTDILKIIAAFEQLRPETPARSDRGALPWGERE